MRTHINKNKTLLGGPWSLLIHMTRRDIGARYKGSVLGLVWSLLTPLFLLLIYTFVFGAVFKSKWPTPNGDAGATPSLAEFAIILFTGLTTFQLFADVVTRAPALILGHKNYVTRVVFPLEILSVMTLGSALFQYLVSMSILVVAVMLTFGSVPPTVLLLPLILMPYCVMILGLGWLFAGLGVFLRDLNQLLATIVSGLMFMAPIFFSRTILPEGIDKWVMLNPITIPVEETRKILIYNQLPDFQVLGIYTFSAIIIALLGWYVFKRLRPGFADVL